MKQTNAIVLATMLGAYSVLASADEAGPGPNGGQVKDAGKYHLELVVKDTALTVYVAGGKGAKVATKGASGTATVLAGKGTSNVKLEPDWNSWYPNAFATKSPTLLWQTGSQASPYGYFNANLSQNSLIPSGTDASSTGNWSHTYNADATGLLNQWKVTLDQGKQQAIATKLETIFLANMPIVPLFVGPRWSTYSTKYFHCFASPKNFYGDPIFSTFPDNSLSFTKICSGGKAGA